MLLSHHHLHYILESNILEGALKENINPASIDVRLGNTILRETRVNPSSPPIDLQAKESISFQELNLDKEEIYTLKPGEFILAQTIEIFNLPTYISAEFRLKSTAARNGLDQALAVWIDAGFNNSVLTIELRNNCQHHNLVLRPGMKIGQVVFYHHFPVPDEASYAVKGQYNNNLVTTKGKELK